MALITTYATLQTEIANWLNREDLTTTIPTFIQLFEAKANRRLRVRDMMIRAEATSEEGYIALPADFLEVHSLTLEDDIPHLPLQYVGADEAKDLKAQGYTGELKYTIVGGSLEIIPDPADEREFEMIYYGKIPALSDSNTTNWLLTKSPDLYLYGSLLECAPYLKDDERIPIWAAAVQSTMDDMQLESERALRPRAALRVRVQGF